MAQRLAAQTGAVEVEPAHVLDAIVVLPRNAAHRALVDLGADIQQLERTTAAGGPAVSESRRSVPMGAATRFLLNNAHREADQIGHYQVDAVHLLLALLYKDSKATADRLEQAGLTIYAVRQYLTAPSPTTKGLRRRPLPSLAGAIRVSPIFAILIGWPFLVFQGLPPFGDFHFWAALAFLVFLQLTALLLNLIPIPPFDGFGIIAPWLSIELRMLANRLGMLPLLVLFYLLWQGGPVGATFWGFAHSLTNLLNVPGDLIDLGRQQFPHL